ncbi:MAG: hypothetical protein H2174_07120 [Vampirovibrio sp.]|nr:hypothetical protein [Vampirovibrio sp.]
MLQGLCDGKIGLLGCDGVAGGHMISLVGIHEIEKDALSKIITKLKNKEGSTLDANLLSNVRLLIYDQQRAEQKQEAFGELPLLTLFQSTTPQQFYNIRLFSQEKPLNYRYESLFKSVKFSPKGFTSPAYHQELMKAGDAVFTSA